MTSKKFEIEQLHKPKANANQASKTSPQDSEKPKVTPWAKELFKRIEKLRKELDGHKLA